MSIKKRRFLILSVLALIVVLWICTWKLLAPLSQADAQRVVETLIKDANNIVILPHHLNPTTRSMFDTNIGPLPSVIDGSDATARQLLVRGIRPQSGFSAFRWRNPFVYDEFSDFYLEIRCQDEVGTCTALFVLDMSLKKCRMTTNDGTCYGTVSGLIEIPEWSDWIWAQVEAGKASKNEQ